MSWILKAVFSYVQWTFVFLPVVSFYNHLSGPLIFQCPSRNGPHKRHQWQCTIETPHWRAKLKNRSPQSCANKTENEEIPFFFNLTYPSWVNYMYLYIRLKIHVKSLWFYLLFNLGICHSSNIIFSLHAYLTSRHCGF